MNTILVITPRFPFPVIGGDRLRIYEICKELSKTNKIILASLCETREELEHEIPDDSVFDTVHRVFQPKWKSYVQCIAALPTNKPLQVAYYKNHEFAKLIKELSKNCQVVLPHLIRVAEYVSNSPSYKVLEMTDAISMNYKRFIDSGERFGIKGAIYKFEYKRLNRYEKRIARKFDLNVLVSNYDRDFLFSDAPELMKRTIVCSNGVDSSKLPYSFSQDNKVIIFIGNMNSTQNFDAAYWFASKVMPLLSNHGNYTFKVIGRIKDDAKNKLLKLSNVLVTGSVENVSEHAKGALAGVCSVRLAAGVQNKILEYMAMGIPCITSSTGLEGLDATPDEDILVADSPLNYVECIRLLESNVELAKKISENGFAYIQNHHSWETKLAPLVELVQKESYK
ncbi:glycosyltransferase [Vibrio metschnikovii]|nr:glycosyltransferase [Vibrio metschnikovii]